MINQTHTFATLEISAGAYTEIAALLKAAGYDHVFAKTESHEAVMDMHGIALAHKPVERVTTSRKSRPLGRRHT